MDSIILVGVVAAIALVLLLPMPFAIIADAKGHSWWGYFLLCFFLLPIGVLIVPMLPDLKLRAEARRIHEELTMIRGLQTHDVLLREEVIKIRKLLEAKEQE